MNDFSVPLPARPFPLSAVRLTGGPLKAAQELDHTYLLQVEPDRILARLRKQAGLAERAPGYGGWEGEGRNLTGHTAGHYLSALCLMYAATGDTALKTRAEYVISELKEIQEKQGDGYIGALTDKDGTDAKVLMDEVRRGEIRSAGFDLNGLWVPWYVHHKVFAGLRDAYRLLGNAEALKIACGLAEWTASILAPLNEEQMQKMLRTEFGGMNEILADLAVDTGDRRWSELSDRFEHQAVLGPLMERTNRLDGLHGNTQVPKLVGSLKRYLAFGYEKDRIAAEFFWEQVTTHHSFATGGHGKDEHFGPPDQLSDRLEGRTCESCNIYNMLKLGRMLFTLHPDIRYAEFEERALFNHVLGSIDPDDGRTCYMVPVGRGVRREYHRMFEDFTCCVGTGMENHAMHGEGIYFASEKRLFVNQFVPSELNWEANGVFLTMETDFPEGETATLTVRGEGKNGWTLAIRRPFWAAEGFVVSVNGTALEELSGPGSYIAIERTWTDGDTVRITLPKTLRNEPLADNPRRVALMYGPLALAGDLGPEAGEGQPTTEIPIPVFVAADRPVSEWLTPVSGSPGVFRSEGVGRDGVTGLPIDVELVPFYRLHRRTYAAYYDLFTPSEWDLAASKVALEQAMRRALEAVTIAFVQPGEMQPERDFGQEGDETWADRYQGRACRRGNRWFSFVLPVKDGHPMRLVVTYHSEERELRDFEILADGAVIGEQTIERFKPGSGSGSFFDVEYVIPAVTTAGKDRVTIRFQAKEPRGIAGVFGIRMCL